MLVFTCVARQAEKSPCLVEDVGEASEAAIESDEIEKIAMLPRRGICLMCS
jgi:hypothetical protein